ncbi:MAG: hypothetical protein RI894_994 [Bacteroidota bacterium]|jgi:hypothetical protein
MVGNIADKELIDIGQFSIRLNTKSENGELLELLPQGDNSSVDGKLEQLNFFFENEWRKPLLAPLFALRSAVTLRKAAFKNPLRVLNHKLPKQLQ